MSLEGLKDIGISDEQVDCTNQIIKETIDSLLSDSKSKDHFIKLCEIEGFYIGHSMLIIYIAGRIINELDFNFSTTMPKICSAAFYHDFSLFGLDIEYDEMKTHDIKDLELSKQIFDHPMTSGQYLVTSSELIEDTKKIIREHHELPNGDGYPKKLTASQISPLSCLFILSQQITFCLIRNNFSKERLNIFLDNAEAEFNQANFSKFYKASRAVFQ